MPLTGSGPFLSQHDSPVLTNWAACSATAAGILARAAPGDLPLRANTRPVPNPARLRGNHLEYVADTYVVPEFRGRGVVSRLLETAESHMREQGVSRMRIWTLANNTSAKRAYEAYGCEPYEVVMEKTLRR
jgi:ribosomal protein S18 acetylase RimI-like enzyme